MSTLTFYYPFLQFVPIRHFVVRVLFTLVFVLCFLPLTMTNCQVCGDSPVTKAYGALVCGSCKSFFQRNHAPPPSGCPRGGHCLIQVPTERGKCASCRYWTMRGLGMEHVDERKAREAADYQAWLQAGSPAPGLSSAPSVSSVSGPSTAMGAAPPPIRLPVRPVTSGASAPRHLEPGYMFKGRPYRPAKPAEVARAIATADSLRPLRLPCAPRSYATFQPTVPDLN